MSTVSETAYIAYTVCNAATAQVIQHPASIAWAVPRGTLAVAGCASAVNVAPPSPACIPPSQLHGDASCCRRARECITSRRARTSSRVDGSRFRLALSNDPPLSCHSASLSDPLSLPLFPAVISCSFPTHPTPPPPSFTPDVDHCPHPGGQWRNFKFRASRDRDAVSDDEELTSKVRPVHEDETSKVSQGKTLMARPFRCGCEQLSVVNSGKAMRTSLAIIKIVDTRFKEDCNYMKIKDTIIFLFFLAISIIFMTVSSKLMYQR